MEAYSFPGLWTSTPCLMIGAQLSKAAAAPKVQLRIRLDWGIGMSEQIRDNPGYGLKTSNRCSAPICYWQGWGGQRGAPLGLVRLLSSFGTLARSRSHSEYARTRNGLAAPTSRWIDAVRHGVDAVRRRATAILQ